MKYQVWGSFAKDDADLEHPTTISCFKEGQKMPDDTLMLDWERNFAASEGEDLFLMYEFDVAPEVWLTEQAQDVISSQIYGAFLAGFHGSWDREGPAES